MKTHSLTTLLLFLAATVFSQQKLLLEKDSVKLYAVFTLKESATCNCACPNKDKKIYQYSVYGKIVNGSSRKISYLNVEMTDAESETLLKTCNVKNASSNSTVKFNGEVSVAPKLFYMLNEACCDWSTGLPNVKCDLKVKFAEPKQAVSAISVVEAKTNTTPKEDKSKMQPETKVAIVQSEVKPVPLVKEEKVVAVPKQEEKVVEKQIAEKPKTAQTESNPDKTEKNKEHLSKVADILLESQPSSSVRLAKTIKKSKGKKRYSGKPRRADIFCIAQEKDIYLYLVIAHYDSKPCNCEKKNGKGAYLQYDIYGKIVNKSSKNIEVTNASTLIKTYHEFCQKKGITSVDSKDNIKLPESPMYVLARSEKYFDYKTSV